MNIGKIFANLRENEGLTQTRAGVKSGVSKAVVHHVEHGVNFPNTLTIDRLSNLYKIPVDVVFLRSIGEPPASGFTVDHMRVLMSEAVELIIKLHKQIIEKV